VFLETQSWVKQLNVTSSTVDTSDSEDDNLSDDDDDQVLSEIKESVDYLASHFGIPLEAKGVVIASL